MESGNHLQRFPAQWLVAILILLLFISTACRPVEPELIVVTEVVHLGDEQVIITRMVEQQPTPTPTAIPTPIVLQPAVLDLAYSSTLPNLDPQQANEKASYDMVENLFTSLTNFNPETQQIEPELAERWTVSTDGLTWTFQLRDDINWIKPVDAQEFEESAPNYEVIRAVNAHDVVEAVKRICTRETNTPDAFIFFLIQGCQAVHSLDSPTEDDLSHIGVQAVDDFTLTFTLTEPASNFLTLTSMPQIRPVPGELVSEHGSSWRDAVGELSDGWQTPEKLQVSGPFIPTTNSFTDEGLTLIKNPYWPIINRGNLEAVNITFQVDDDEMYQSWLDKEIDMSVLPIAMREEFLGQTPAKAKLIPNQTMFYLGINFDSPVFKEAEVRRAFNAAIDREILIEEMFDGRAVPMRHFTPPGAFGAPPVDEVGTGYSPDYARLQMDQSVFHDCKLILPVKVLVSTSDLSLVQAELIRDQWIEELGCVEDLIEIDQVSFGKLLTNTEGDAGAARPDMWELAWPPYYPDAHNVLTDLLHCSEGENRQNRACADADRLLRQAKLTPQLSERQELYRQVENLFFGENGIVPLIPLYVRGDYTVVQTWLDYDPVTFGGDQFDTYIIDEELKRLERSRDQ